MLMDGKFLAEPPRLQPRFPPGDGSWSELICNFTRAPRKDTMQCSQYDLIDDRIPVQHFEFEFGHVLRPKKLSPALGDTRLGMSFKSSASPFSRSAPLE